MPKNNRLEPVKLPMPLRFGEEPTTGYKNNLDSIKVTLLNAPSVNELREYLVPFVMATWNDDPFAPNKEMTTAEKDEVIRAVFTGKALPTAMETIGCTWLLEGISLQEVTHILRHRLGSFSAECSGDKWWTHKNALVPAAVQNSPEFYERYQKIVEDSKKLYCDMIDSKEISIMDSRYILPRCLETFYFMRLPLGDTFRFIQQRIDRAIQPETDNIIAYQMITELQANFGSLMDGLWDLDAPSQHFIKTARTGKATNLYQPEPHNDKFEWHEDDFIYKKRRDEMNGTKPWGDEPNRFSKFLEYFKAKIR